MKNTIFVISIFMLFSLAFAEDHSEFFEDEFSDPTEVTATCLECHEDAGYAFLNSAHWTWSSLSSVSGHAGKMEVGKRNLLNNFCIGLESNWPRCTSCHAGYGWKDDDFDFSDPYNIDCLVCHDNSGTYKKTPTGAGFPDKNVDLLEAAQSVGMPTRQNCGSCHFYGGGGNNVKHGDLEKALVNPSSSLDVHMGDNDFTCQECHETYDHVISGKGMSVSPHTSKTLTCENCHDSEPHVKYAKYLNAHAEKIACQTCHIPEFARENPTKLYWDWSQAGTNQPNEVDEFGMPKFSKKKGTFEWGKNVVPTYSWYNGDSKRMLVGEKANMKGVTKITEPLGSRKDGISKIYPFKVHKGRQIADERNEYLLPTHLFGKGGFWKTFDWSKSVDTGAKLAGLEFSGKYKFVETEMYWRINHMVAPREESLKCGDCHSKREERRLPWSELGYDGDPRFNK